jgi:outer membrane protein FlgP
MKLRTLIFLTALGSLNACSNFDDKYIEYRTEQPKEFAVLHATGYAPISSQPGHDDTAKMLNAIHASKLAAYRELSEQVHGQQISGQASLSDLVMSNSTFKSSVQGLIRGARVVQSYPVNDDIYATELELDFRVVYQLYTSSALPRRVINH